MEDLRSRPEQPPPTTATARLLVKRQEKDPTTDRDADDDLDGALRNLEFFFLVFGFKRSCKHRTSIFSWAIFLLLGFVLPALVVSFFYVVSDGESSRIFLLDVGVPVSQALLAFFSLLCISHNHRKYGMERFLFVDKGYEEMERLHRLYVAKIKAFYPTLFFWMLPLFIAKIALMFTLIFFIYPTSWPLAIAVMLASVTSWTYITTVFLSGCNLFYLTCSLQVVNLDDYKELLENLADVSVLFNEHRRLRFYLSKISHRFRVYLILLFFVSVVTQAIFLLQTTQFRGVIYFVNVGDFFISSAVQVIGIVVCLNAATRISHRAQNVVSAASSWHVLTTCKDYEKLQTNESGSMGVISANLSEWENLGIMQPQIMIQSYIQREALVTYLGCNTSGITIYGWCVDRGLITTIVGIELSILCFIFSGTL